jgi:pilus assembly protein CpaC
MNNNVSSPCLLRIPPSPWRTALTVVAATVFTTSLAGPALSPAHATDAAVIDTSGGQQRSGRLLRLGLSKSAVIKLPAGAKDVVVGDSSIVDVVLRRKDTAYLFARKTGQTNLFFFGEEGQEILHLDLEVAADIKGLNELLERAIPGNSIIVDSASTNIVLRGTVANAAEAKRAEDLANSYLASSSSGFFGSDTPSSKIVNLLTIAEGHQVALKVRVVELKRTVMKELGINLNGALGDLAFQNTPVGIFDQLGSRILDSTLKIGSGSNSVDVRLQALEEQGLATTLAEPTLTAVSGASASFQAGGEFPYRECSQTVEGTLCEIQFKPYGVTLAFTPTVLAENRIALNIATEVSELGDRELGIPAIDRRRAQTTVEIPSGGSMMMAGLIKDVTSQDIKGAPGLKSLPVLGALFSSREYEQDQTELVVIVTPFIVNPVKERQLATPVDGFNPPTDLQQIFLGRLNRVYGPPGGHPAGVFHGQVGHIID